eukprot:7570177-Pyramimonas_sp.AAC.1
MGDLMHLLVGVLDGALEVAAPLRARHAPPLAAQVPREDLPAAVRLLRPAVDAAAVAPPAPAVDARRPRLLLRVWQLLCRRLGLRG